MPQAQATWLGHIPFLWLVGAYLLLIWSHNRGDATAFGVMAAVVGAIIALVLFRQVIALQENAHLNRQLSGMMGQVRDLDGKSIGITRENNC